LFNAFNVEQADRPLPVALIDKRPCARLARIQNFARAMRRLATSKFALWSTITGLLPLNPARPGGLVGGNYSTHRTRPVPALSES
jgi:hypothetical protein